jgi:hypothetical protein
MSEGEVMIGRQLAGRSVVVGAIGALCLTAGGLGVATAANGGSLVLGQHNTATSTTTLKTSDGTPLSLVGKKSKAPLKVNSSKQVKHLNASLLGGLSAAEVSAGSAAKTGTDEKTGATLSDDPDDATLVARTAKLAKGTYYVSASALLDGPSSTDGGGFCFVSDSANNTDAALQFGGGGFSGFLQATETVAVKLATSHTISEFCYGNDTGATVYNAGILATRIAHSKTGSAIDVTALARTHVRRDGPGR